MNIFAKIWRWINDTCPVCGKELAWAQEWSNTKIQNETLDVGYCKEHGEVR